MIKMTYPNRLVRIPDIGILAEQIVNIRGTGELDRLELPCKQQNAERQRLAGVIGQLQIKDSGKRLEFQWKGGDGRYYQATLVGLDTERSYAVVTSVTSERREDPYKRWHAVNGPWF